MGDVSSCRRRKLGDKLQTWEIRFAKQQKEGTRAGERGKRVARARESNKAFVPASSLDTQIKSFCREPGLFPLYANQRHTAAR